MSQMLSVLSLQPRERHYTRSAMNDLAVFKHDQRRYARNLVPARDLALCFGVDLDEANAVAPGVFQVFQNRREHMAWPAPVGIEVDQHWYVTLLNQFVELSGLRSCHIPSIVYIVQDGFLFFRQHIVWEFRFAQNDCFCHKVIERQVFIAQIGIDRVRQNRCPKIENHEFARP